MAISIISKVMRCAILLVVSVEVWGQVPVATRPPPVRHDSQETATEVEPQPTGHYCGDESLVLEVAEARCQVQRSLDRLDDIEDALKLVLHHVTDERVVIQRSLDKLAGIEARLTGRNVCSSNQCLNGGTCVDENNHFRCACVTGYTGVHCELRRNMCSSNQCLNGGTCVDENNHFRCACVTGYTGVHCELVTHRDCKDVRTAMGSVSGLYTVTPRDGTPTQVYCDMNTTGGGWLVFQNRVDGSVDFYLNWTSYAAGFGDLNGEFWLGNRNLHLLTAQKNYTLRVALSDWEGNQRYAQYRSFTIGSEQDKFRMTVSGYSGDAGDALSYSSGRQFSARDADNDRWGGAHCAQLARGAWWYGACGYSNLNGHYYPAGPYTRAQSQTGYADGVRWQGWKGSWYSLKSTRMMLRPAP